MLIQIIFHWAWLMLIQFHFFSLGLAHANPHPFFHWAWHMLIQIHFFTGLGLQSHRLSDSLGALYPQGLSSMHGVVASPCHLHCLDTIIQYIELSAKFFGGVSLSLSQVVLSLGGTYSIISSPQKIANKKFVLYVQSNLS